MNWVAPENVVLTVPNSHGSVAIFLQGATGSAANTTAVNAPTARGLESRSIWSSIKHAVSSAPPHFLRLHTPAGGCGGVWEALSEAKRAHEARRKRMHGAVLDRRRPCKGHNT